MTSSAVTMTTELYGHYLNPAVENVKAVAKVIEA